MVLALSLGCVVRGPPSRCRILPPAPTRRAPGRAKRDFRAKGANLATLRPSYGIARAAPPPAELPARPLGCVEHGPTSGRPILHQHGEHGRPQNELFRPVEVR